MCFNDTLNVNFTSQKAAKWRVSPKHRQDILLTDAIGTRDMFSQQPPESVLTCAEHKHLYLFKQLFGIVKQKQPVRQSLDRSSPRRGIGAKSLSFHSALHSLLCACDVVRFAREHSYTTANSKFTLTALHRIKLNQTLRSH